MQIDRKEIVKLFEFVVQKVDRLEKLRQTDRKQAALEAGLYRLPLTYDDFPKNSDYRGCGKEAAHEGTYMDAGISGVHQAGISLPVVVTVSLPCFTPLAAMSSSAILLTTFALPRISKTSRQL